MKTKTRKSVSCLTLQASLLICSLLTLHCSLKAQQYGWIDLSNNIPTSVPNANLTDVAAIGESVWISCSNLKGIFSSNDGGQTFVFDSLNVGIQGLYRFPDSQRGWAVGGAYGFKTIDGGQNWSPVFIGSTLLNVTFANDNTGYATGLGSVYRTDDGGATWMKQSTISNLGNRDVMDAAFPDPGAPLSGFVCVANEISTIFHTSDGGQNWDPVTLSWVTSSVSDLEMISPEMGYAVGGGGNIFCYANDSWTFQNSSCAENLNGVAITPDGEGVWAVGNNGTIIFKENSGNWVQQAVGLTVSYLASVDAVSSHKAYAVGLDKTFLKWLPLEGLNESGEAGMHSDVNVFPNPGRGIYSLQFTNFNLQSVGVEVVDIYRKVLEPGTMNVEPGTRNLELDLAGYPAGVYLLRINSENQMIVKKIVKQ